MSDADVLEYVRGWGALGLRSDPTLAPADRRASLPRWICPALIATEHARTRLHAWVDAGRPEPSALEIGLRLLFEGSGHTLALIRGALGDIAPPAVWHLVERVRIVALGRDCIGLCTPAPHARVERDVFILDDRSDDEVVSVFLHEAAHAFLMPTPRRDLTPTEEALVSGPEFWRTAAALGLFDTYRATARRDEEQACVLAAMWGATGRPADPGYCAAGAGARAQQEAGR